MHNLLVIRDGSVDELPALRALLRVGLAVGFDPAPVVEEKLFAEGFGGKPRCRVATFDGRVAGVAVTCGSAVRLLVVEKDVRGRGIGTELLEDAEGWIAPRFSRITIAAAAGNYLVPGIPAHDEASLRFFRNRGYTEHARATDMIVDLNEIRPPMPEEFRLSLARSMSDDLDQFLRESFGEAIAWEIGRGLSPGGAVVRVAHEGERIVGFSGCEINNAGLGTFGPQGVASEVRGRGVGSALLLASLADLRSLGYARARIPWVSSVSYYVRSCGARVSGEYIVLRRTL